MLRSLIMVNGRPFSPIRTWRKKTGPGESSLMAMAATKMAGAETTRPSSAPAISIARLTRRFQPGITGCRAPGNVPAKWMEPAA